MDLKKMNQKDKFENGIKNTSEKQFLQMTAK